MSKHGVICWDGKGLGEEIYYREESAEMKLKFSVLKMLSLTCLWDIQMEIYSIGYRWLKFGRICNDIDMNLGTVGT